MRISSRQYTKEWTINSFPLQFVEMMYDGDTSALRKYLGVAYGGHVMASEADAVTFFQNRRTAATMQKAGKRIYLNEDRVHKFLMLTKAVERELMAALLPLRRLPAKMSERKILNHYQAFRESYAALFGVYRFTRPVVYETVIQEAIKQLPVSEQVQIGELLQQSARQLSIKVPKRLRRIFRALKMVGERRLALHAVYSKAFEEARPLYSIIARKAQLPTALVLEATKNEIRELLLRHCAPPRLLLQRRKRSYALRYKAKGYQLLYERVQFRDETKSAKNPSLITGACAYQGKTCGRVRLITHHIGKTQLVEMRTMKHGEVLVTVSTSPDMMPAIHKSAAIVVDEGGILSHAAIVSRELQKPCVIGTKEATKRLKNGDRVEVDATNGIVRKV